MQSSVCRPESDGSMNIDREIAKKVMEMTPYGQRRGEFMMVFWHSKGKEPWIGKRNETAGSYVKFKPEELDPYKQAITEPPKYSTDIGQAFGVVEKMDEDEFEFTLMKSKTNYRAMFVNQRARKSGVGIDKNPATAICLASLAAKKDVEINNGNLHT